MISHNDDKGPCAKHPPTDPIAIKIPFAIAYLFWEYQLAKIRVQETKTGPQPIPTRHLAKHDNANIFDCPIIIDPTPEMNIEKEINLPGLITSDKTPPIGCIAAYVQKYMDPKTDTLSFVTFNDSANSFVKMFGTYL